MFRIFLIFILTFLTTSCEIKENYYEKCEIKEKVYLPHTSGVGFGAGISSSGTCIPVTTVTSSREKYIFIVVFETGKCESIEVNAEDYVKYNVGDIFLLKKWRFKIG